MGIREDIEKSPYSTVGDAVADLADLRGETCLQTGSFEMAGQRRLNGFSSLPDPSWRWVPPNNLRSMIATFIPEPARLAANEGPDCPVPIIIASYFVAIGSTSLC